MAYATEFFAVQNALQIENASNVSSSPFKSLDEQFKAEGRLEDTEKEVEGLGTVRAIFVDGKMVFLTVDGQECDADPSEVREALGM